MILLKEFVIICSLLTIIQSSEDKEDYLHLPYDRVQRSKQNVTKAKVSSEKNSPNVIQKEQVMFIPNNNDYNEHTGDFIMKATEYLSIHIKQSSKPDTGSLWPIPAFLYMGKKLFSIDENKFKILISKESVICDIIEQAILRTKAVLFINKQHKPKIKSGNIPKLRELVIVVNEKCGDYPQSDMVEKYEIKFSDDKCIIFAQQVWGMLHALQTFSQMVFYNSMYGYVVKEQKIIDGPLFPHRGLLIDTSRHFISMQVLLNNIDIMAANKLNVLHWHIVDDNSFPFESLVFPNLTLFGAYDKNTIYTQEDIRKLLNFARLRGIRVIPEFDTPGHTYSWGYGVNHLLVECHSDGTPTGTFGPINPTLKLTFKFLRALFSEILLLFKDNSIHLGGDEVTYECWENNVKINAFMSSNSLKDIKSLLKIYEQRLLKLITKIGKKIKKKVVPIVWQEVVDDNALEDGAAIIEIWKSRGNDLNEFITLNSKFKFIYSSCWYLDHISYGADWVKYYLCDDISMLAKKSVHILDNPNDKNVLGGEICMWTEFVDSQAITPRIWPRASAAAERLWSHVSADADIITVSNRLEEHRCRMLKRGFQVGVLGGPGHCLDSLVTETREEFDSLIGQVDRHSQHSNQMIHKNIMFQDNMNIQILGVLAACYFAVVAFVVLLLRVKYPASLSTKTRRKRMLQFNVGLLMFTLLGYYVAQYNM